jgi:hypothetical protein
MTEILSQKLGWVELKEKKWAIGCHYSHQDWQLLKWINSINPLGGKEDV